MRLALHLLTLKQSSSSSSLSSEVWRAIDYFWSFLGWLLFVSAFIDSSTSGYWLFTLAYYGCIVTALQYQAFLLFAFACVTVFHVCLMHPIRAIRSSSHVRHWQMSISSSIHVDRIDQLVGFQLIGIVTELIQLGFIKCIEGCSEPNHPMD